MKRLNRQNLRYIGSVDQKAIGGRLYEISTWEVSTILLIAELSNGSGSSSERSLTKEPLQSADLFVIDGEVQLID